MKRHRVQSSNIFAIGHAGDVMEVQFTNDTVYHVTGATPEIVAQIRSAESVGKAYHQLVKQAGLTVTKMETGECPLCGSQLGVVGTRCDDCGCADYAKRAPATASAEAAQ